MKLIFNTILTVFLVVVIASMVVFIPPALEVAARHVGWTTVGVIAAGVAVGAIWVKAKVG